MGIDPRERSAERLAIVGGAVSVTAALIALANVDDQGPSVAVGYLVHGSPLVVLAQLLFILRRRPALRRLGRAAAGTIVFVGMTATLCLNAYGVAMLLHERSAQSHLNNPNLKCFSSEYRKCP